MTSHAARHAHTVQWAVSAQPAAVDNNNGRLNKTTPLPGTETMASIECLAGIVFVYHEAFLAEFGPYCQGLTCVP